VRHQREQAHNAARQRNAQVPEQARHGALRAAPRAAHARSGDQEGRRACVVSLPQAGPACRTRTTTARSIASVCCGASSVHVRGSLVVACAAARMAAGAPSGDAQARSADDDDVSYFSHDFDYEARVWCGFM
jgi:hypothetical protein